MKYWRLLMVLLCLLITTACQEISISIEIPEKIPAYASLENVKKTSWITPIPFSTDIPVEPTIMPSPSAVSAAVDPAAPLLRTEDLPLELGLTGGDLKIFNTSYLYSPGKLAGLAYVREFSNPQGDLFFTEILVYSPVPVTAEMMRAGYFGKTCQPVDEEMRLGDFTLFCQRNDMGNPLGLRFSEGSLLVVLTMHGENSYKTRENLFSLAQKITPRLPGADAEILAELEPLPVLLTDNLEVFQSIQLTECEAGNKPNMAFENGDQGICFSVELTELVLDFKAGIYSPKYDAIFYLSEFQSFLKLGTSNQGLFRPVSDFGWQHLPAGEYQALFWVGNQLAAVLPFTFKP